MQMKVLVRIHVIQFESRAGERLELGADFRGELRTNLARGHEAD